MLVLPLLVHESLQEQLIFFKAIILHCAQIFRDNRSQQTGFS